jgi:hypothetical protein
MEGLTDVRNGVISVDFGMSAVFPVKVQSRKCRLSGLPVEGIGLGPRHAPAHDLSPPFAAAFGGRGGPSTGGSDLRYSAIAA